MSAFKGEAADKELLNAHISVMTAEEVEQIGADKINERGHHFHYALGQVREFSPEKAETLSRVWAIQVASPELAALRKSYGLSPLPNGDHQFHITCAVRRKNVLGPNEVAKVDGTRGETKAAEVKDLLPGGEADHVPDSEFNTEALAEGKKHEREHTDNGQIAQEIAKDHLSEDPAYYKKVEQIEKDAQHPALADLHEAKQHSDAKRYEHKTAILRRLMTDAPQDWHVDDASTKYHGITHKPTGFQFHMAPQHIPSGVKAASSVYLNQALHALNPMTVAGPTIPYDHNKPVFENIQNQLAEVKRRGDFVLQANRNHQIWRSQLDPNYRYQLAIQAFRGELPQPGLTDQLIERYGDGVLAALPQRRS